MKIKLILIDKGDYEFHQVTEQIKNYPKADNEFICQIQNGFDSYFEKRNLFYDFLVGCETLNLNPIVITNDVLLLNEISVDYREEDWDELYLWNDKGIINAKEIYPNIRAENNLLKMYICGMFKQENEQDNEEK